MNYKVALFILFTAVFGRSVVLLSEEQSDAITIVATENSLPFSFSLPDGTPTGLYVEFWELWSATNKIPIDIVLTPFDTGLQRVKNKNMVHAGLFKSKQREQWADFSLPIHNVKTGVIYNGSFAVTTKLRDVPSAKIATQHSSFQETFLKENFPESNIVSYDNLETGITKLLDNEVQAVVGELPNIYAHLAKMGLSGVFTVSEESLITNDVFGLIAKGQPRLLSLINRGIENIPINKIIALEKKWLPTLKPFFKEAVSFETLTLAEKHFLKLNHTFSVGVDSAWYPYEYLDDNEELQGIASDYIGFINDKLGITLNHNANYSWAEAVEKFKVGKIDIISSIGRTPEREKYMAFTKPYFSVPTVIVIKKHAFYADSINHLIDRKVGLIKNFPLIELIKADYPDLNIFPLVSVEDGIQKLHDGEIDAFINTATVINHEIEKRNFNDLTIAGFSPYKIEVSMAVRKGLEPLIPILNKVFDSMSERTKNSIANNWLSTNVQTGTEIKVILMWALPILSFLLLIIIIYININQKLKAEIAHRKNSEKEQRILESQLHQSQKMEALGKLTGGIAHDFNNMLGIILGYADLLKRKSLDDKQLASYVEHISHAGERGAKLTKKLMSFTRKQNIEAEEINLNNLLRQQQDMLEKTLTVRIKLTLNLREDLWNIWLDSSDLEDAIINMSINAMHAMSGSHPAPELIIKTDNSVITEDLTKETGLVPGEYVKLCLVDNGCGMTEETSKQIFDPFFSTKGNKGTGLGLSQVFGFLQRSGGGIIVNSSLEHGTHFTLYFPRFIGESNNNLDDSMDELQNLKGSETILIVDDELALRDLAVQHLEGEGYRTLIADSGQSAIDMLNAEEVDLVLTDVIMPEMDGYQLFAKIKKSHPTVKVQLVSGFADEKNRGFADDDLQLNLIHKPYNRTVLLQRVRALLDS